ncbi:hypothetical protein PR048_021411 [Dryococelus australis]|uniref:Uncharacterized protein n=1 Tax=Dryococelus australis TaxID=614101 RepID=A0ABQ9GY45_9NEOP|nr:hypothetical protein PR048_021411 [Dryococelus australis]
MYQIQGVHFSRRKTCNFVVWTPEGMKLFTLNIPEKCLYANVHISNLHKRLNVRRINLKPELLLKLRKSSVKRAV